MWCNVMSKMMCESGVGTATLHLEDVMQRMKKQTVKPILQKWMLEVPAYISAHKEDITEQGLAEYRLVCKSCAMACDYMKACLSDVVDIDFPVGNFRVYDESLLHYGAEYLQYCIKQTDYAEMNEIERLMLYVIFEGILEQLEQRTKSK